VRPEDLTDEARTLPVRLLRCSSWFRRCVQRSPSPSPPRALCKLVCARID
jgi:hypothetical protein